MYNNLSTIFSALLVSKKQKLIIYFCILLTLGKVASADFTTTVIGDVKQLKNVFINGLERQMAFSFRLPGSGIQNLIVDKIEKPDWKRTINTGLATIEDPTDFRLLHGRVRTARNDFKKFVGTVTKGAFGNRAHFYVSKEEAGDRLYSIDLNLDNSSLDANVNSIPLRVLLNRGLCGVEQGKFVISDSAYPNEPQLRSGQKIASISTDADYEYFSQYGSETNATIAAIVTTASELYADTFGVTFAIKGQNVFTSMGSSPYRETSAERMLVEFQNYHLKNRHLPSANVYHLFTGKNILGSTIGVAYVGAVCQENGTYSYGISQRFHPSADYVVFAHELGHNFNGTHDLTDAGSIMYPAASLPPPTRWSAQSKREIGGFINSISCLGQTSVTPSPTATNSASGTGVPTGTPLSTPTPVGGGSFKPGISPTYEGGTDFTATLSARNIRGKVLLKIGFSPWDNSCVGTILASAPNDGLTEQTVLTKYLVSTSIVYQALMSNPTRAKSISLRLVVACSNTNKVALTEPVDIKLSSLNPQNKRINLKRWVTQLSKRLRVKR